MAWRRILVINPNSSLSATAAIDASLSPLRLSGGPRIDVTRLTEGPPAIVSQADVQSVVQPLCDLVRREPADGFVIACFSDPGLHDVQAAARGRPVMGIGQWGLLKATTLGRAFGIIALSPASAERQQRQVQLHGLEARYAGSEPVDATPGEVMAGAVFDSLRAAGERLRDHYGADVVILGCAGMAAHRVPLARALDMPVVEPTQEATTAALGAVCLADDC